MLRKIQTILIIVIPLIGFIIYIERNSDHSSNTTTQNSVVVVRIGKVPLQVEVANSDSARARGLSGRDKLGELEGLLMIFEKPDYYSIWMKDMRFPIDVIWVDEDMQIVSITKNLLPNSYPKAFWPPQPIKYLIETNAHLSDKFDISIGDYIEPPKGLLPGV